MNQKIEDKKKKVLIFFVIFGFLIISNIFSFKVNSQTDNLSGTVKVAVCGNDVKEPLEQCDGLDVGNQTCFSLGFTSGSLLCRPSCQFLTSSCEISNSVDDTEEGVFTYESGGDLELTNFDDTSTNINIPEEAYSNDLSLFAFSEPSENVSDGNPAPSGESFVGNVYHFLFFDENGGRIRTLLNSATISISYLDSQIVGLSESNLAPYHYSEDDSEWYLIPGSTLNTSENTVTFDTTSFSLFALFSSPPTSSEDSGSGSSSSSSGSGGGYFSRFIELFSADNSVVVSADFNNDNIVDISDLSIMLYWWGKTGVQIQKYDLNSDGIIDITDASIMFYHWS